MNTDITVTIGGKTLTARLGDSPVASSLLERLPTEVPMSRWGEEYYGSVGVGMIKLAGERDVLAVGEIAYWPPGDALCFFFGPTPVSEEGEPRAASDVVPLGRFLTGTEWLTDFGGTILAKLTKSP